MTRFVGRHIAPEMLALSLLEVGLAFLLAYAVLSPDGLNGGLQPSAASHALVVALTVAFTSFLLGLYRPQLFTQTRSLMLNTALGGVVAFPVVWLVSEAMGISSDWLVGPDQVWPRKILATWVATLLVIRLCFLLAVRSKVFVGRVAILGAPAEVAGTVAAIRTGRAGFLEVTGVVSPGDAPSGLRATGVRLVVTTAATFAAMGGEVREAFTAAKVKLEPEPVFWERRLRRIDVDGLTAEWFAALERRPYGRVQAAVTRVGDVLLSLVFLVFTLPLMLLVALLVRLDSAGPVLYRQERVGLDGRPFVLLKFRSMRTNAEARGPAWAQLRDPRVTRVGAFMRRTRIDELPQLLNVLRGEMSFIGPRPERPHFVEQLSEVIPHYHERARVKPGLTGWAQVNFPYGASVEDARAKLSYDLYYVKNRSLLLDVLILFATVRVILFQEGAR